MIPSVGRIVHYRLNAVQANQINNRRSDATISRIAKDRSGAVVHVGNPTREGDVYPMLITRVWDDVPTEQSVVQGQVFLDGNDNLWVTSAKQGLGLNEWCDPRPALAL